MPSALLAAVVVVVDLASVGFVSVRLATRFAPDPTQRLERWTVGMLVGLLDIILVAQLCAALTIFSRGWVLAFQLGVALVAAAAGRAPNRTIPSEHHADPPVAAFRQQVVAGVVIGLATAFLLAWIFLALARSTSDPDTLNYHLPNAMHFVQSGSIWGLPVSVPPFVTNGYPSNGELLGAWLMLPTHSPALALLEPVPFAVLSVLGAALVTKRLGRSPLLGAGAALVVVGAPVFYISVDSMLTDLAGVAGLIAAIALILAADGPHRRRGLILAGLAAGLSLGAKDTALIPTLLELALVAWLAGKGGRWRDMVPFALAALVPAGIWYLRDGIELGNPLFPAGLVVSGHSVLAGASGLVTQFETPMAYHLLTLNGGPLRTWLHALRLFVAPTVVLSAVATIVALAFAVRRRDRVLGALGALVALWTVTYLLTPTTGGGRTGNATLITSQLRYDLPALMLGAVLAASALRRWLAEAALAVCLIYDIARIYSLTSLIPHAHRQAALIAGCVVAFPVFVVVWRHFLWPHRAERPRRLLRRFRSSGSPVRVTAGASLFLCGIAVAGLVLHELPVPSSSSLDRALGGRSGTVLVVGVTDVATIIGPHLRNRVVTVRGSGVDHENVIDPRRALLEAIRHDHPQALVTSPHLGDGLAGWRPAGDLREPSGYRVGTIYVPVLPAP